MNLGNSLFHTRKKCGLTQEYVAEKLGVSRQTVSNGKQEFPIVKDTTPNMTNPRLYIISNNKTQ